MVRHGVTVYLNSRTLVVEVGLFIEEEELPFCWDNEKVYYNIKKPIIQYLEELENFELNIPTPPEVWNKSHKHITAKERVPLYIPTG